MKIRHLFPFALCASLALSRCAVGAPIPGLFNTGVGTNGALLASGAVDPHWRMIQSPDLSFPGPNAIVLNDAGFPIPPWLANGPNSKWLAPQASQATGNAPGDYKFRITFDLTGLEPFTAVITGTWTSDNAGPEVLLNGVSTGFAGDGNFPVLGNAFTINSGFIDGTNTLDFVVNNASTAINPTGIRVELSGTADLQPPPGTPPAIAVPPASLTVGLLDVATFNVTATGSRPFSFQWRQGGSPLANATNANFTIGNARLSDAGTYDVIVSNPAGSVTSVVANLTVVFLSPAQLSYEPLGPSSRRTGLTFSEIMYHPRDRADLRHVEFVEIYNSNPFQEDISGYRLTGELDYTFPNGTIIPGLGFLVVAPSPADVQVVYGISGVLGGSTDQLNNNGGTIRLQKKSGGVILETTYSDQPPWPIAADSAGHSLVLARPSYGENDPKAWAASASVGGSPGVADPVPTGPLEDVVINEILAHTDLPLLDFVELHNHSTRSVDLSGCWLTDDADTNKFRIADGTTLPPGGFISFDENQLGFALRASGDEVLLVNSNQTRVIDAVRFGGQANGIAYGRFPDGDPTFQELSTRTPGNSNAPPLLRDIVINEIMFNPLSGNDDDEFVELHNRGAAPVNVGGWRFIEGITYTIPAGTTIPAGGYLVVAQNKAHLLTNYAGLTAANTVGNFNGSVANGGERLVLGIPDTLLSTNTNTMTITTNLFYSVADEVAYADGGRWGRWADGGGSSLELIDAHSDNRAGASWADSDDTAKSSWTTVEFTGVLDLGSGTADKLDILLFGEGEALVDDIEVLVAGVNRVTNSTLESGISGWLLEGTHNKSSLETNGFNSARSIHLRASDRGDQAANHLRTTLSSAVTVGATATLRARVRWLRGNPEILLRLKGNYLEAFGRLAVPANLGTPGAVNSQVRANIGPTIADVSHRPILPQAGQPIRVAARVSDPDLVAAVSLKYRIDPDATLSTVPMVDDGTGPDALAGDGVYTGLIPPQTNGKLIAFRVEATDGFGSPATTQFPTDAPIRECLVRVGEAQPPGSFGTYRLWLTAATVNTWATREKLSNENLDGTFVYGSRRAVYNVGSHYSGSSYTSPGYTSPVGALCGYDITFPSDELFLGENHTIMDWPVRDTTEQREQMMYWLLDQFGLPNMYRRYVIMYVNGLRRGELMDDIQQPSGSTVEEWFPDDSDGTLLKTDCWDEFNDVGDRETGCVALNALQHFTTTGGAKKIARYRWTWRPRATRGTANDFSDLFALIDSADAPVANYQSALEGLADMEHWMRTFAANDLPSYWDSFGNPNAKNTYLYKPENDRWKLMCWDMDVGLGANTVNAAAEAPNAALFPALGDPNMNRIYAHPAFLRLYWNALDEAVNTFFQSGPGTKVDEILNAKYAAFQASGLNIVSPFVPSGGNNISIPDWINQRRAFLLAQLATVSSTFSVTGTNSFSTNRNFITISGTAPVRAWTISVNGISYPITWTTVTSWRMLVPLADGTNVLNVTARDRNGGALSNQTLTVNSTATSPSPQNVVVINEIMFHPLEPDAEYVEIFNTSTNFAFDLSNWRINGLDYTFPAGTVITNRQFIVLAKDRAAFIRGYSNAIPVLDVYSGNLQSDGETLTLIRPAANSNEVDLVVDKVRYENRTPWSTNANGTGSSLQVIDPNQENSRVGNWFSSFVPAVVTPAISTPTMPRDGWRFFSVSGNIGTGEGSGPMRLLMYLDSPGSAILDDIAVVAGTTPAVGYNYVSNGDFEVPLDSAPTNGWRIGANCYGDTHITSDLVHAGSGAFKIIGTNAAGTANPPSYNRAIYQFLSPAPAQNSINTLSFWYWATNSATNLFLRIRNSAALTTGGSGTNLQIFITPSNFVAAVTNKLATNSLSPGTVNQMITNLAPFQPLWINEVQAENTAGILDSYGERDPWVEIFNTSTNAVSLEGLYLTHTYPNLTNWAFPAGSSIGPTQFLIVFCDGQSLQTSNTEYHTSFRLPAASGSLALSRIHSNAPQVMDYVNYAGLHADRSYGSFPDGQPFDRQEFFYVTPGGTNNGTSGPLVVFINEWMAGNASALADPADGNFEDWFELYNPATNAVDLAGYYLTDSLTNAAGVVTNKLKYLITTNGPHVIPPQGYLLVWADNETGQNVSGGVPRPDLHVNFALSLGGEAIGLFAADGTQIDRVTFGQQTNDVSEGRFPDGGPGIYSMPNSVSPRAANYLPGAANAAPVLDGIGNKIIFLGQTLAFTANASDSDVPLQALTFSLAPTPPAGASITGAGLFNWTPAAAGTNTLTIRVTDNGAPPMSDSETITVEVLSAIRFASSLRNGDKMELTWATRAGKSYAVEFKDDLNASQWTPLGTNVAAGSSLSITNTTTNVLQRFFRIRTVE